MPGFLTIGHRGAAGHEPENTLRSIRKALELGADAVEFDVHCLDGQLVVFHDATLERTTKAAAPSPARRSPGCGNSTPARANEFLRWRKFAKRWIAGRNFTSS
jgi:glycerophosphoryl diester phosphodiesterase